MMRLLSPRVLRWLVPALLLLTLGTGVGSAAAAERGPGRHCAIVAVVGLSLLTTIAWLIVHRAASAVVSARARAGSLQAQLEDARGRLANILHSQGRFVGNIAHEIKNPLTTALVQVDLLHRCSDDRAAVAGLAKSISADLQHLADLVGSFLRLARPLAQADTSHHVPVHVHDLVIAAVARCQPFARQGGVRIVTTLADPGAGEAPEVLGDDVLLRAMIENLVRNAVRFSPRGSLVELQVHRRGETVLLTLRDHGTGIAAEHFESVFEWFFTEPGRQLPTSGTGFGLAIAKRVAEHHGGTIALRNRPEGGCEFEVSMPCRRASDQPATVAAASTAWPA